MNKINLFTVLFVLSLSSTFASYQKCTDYVNRNRLGNADNICNRFDYKVVVCGKDAYVHNKRMYSSGAVNLMFDGPFEAIWTCQNHGVDRVRRAMSMQRHGTSLKSLL